MPKKEFNVKETNGNEIKLCIKNPTYEDFEEADRVYSAKIATLVRQKGNKKLLLRNELNTFLKETGVWSDEDDEKVQNLQKEVDTLLSKIKKGGEKLSVGRKLAIETMDKRKEIVRIMSKRQVFDDATIEATAENEKTDYLIYSCTVHADNGNNYWESFEDMKNDKISNVYREASVAAMDVLYGINIEFEKNLPENKWLKKYSFVDENLNYIDRKTGEKVDRDGKPLKILEESITRQLQNLQGDINEDQPFVDDDTGDPIIVRVEEKKEDKEDKKDKNTEEEIKEVAISP